MPLERCAACKYFRRRCPSDCIFYPYFPATDPQRFDCVRTIYKACNIEKMLQKIPPDQRAEAAKCLYYEARCRIKDPVYGVVGIITDLHQQIHNAESELAKIYAELAIISAHAQGDHMQYQRVPISSSLAFFTAQDGATSSSLLNYDPSTSLF